MSGLRLRHGLEGRARRSSTRIALAMGLTALVAGVAAGLTLPGPEVAFAKPKQVKVRVYDNLGRSAKNVDVYVFQGTTIACKCDEPKVKCLLNTVQTHNTRNSGNVRITGLAANTTYTVAVGSQCTNKTIDVCNDPIVDCTCTKGNGEEFTTNSRGGASRTIELTAPPE